MLTHRFPHCIIFSCSSRTLGCLFVLSFKSFAYFWGCKRVHEGRVENLRPMRAADSQAVAKLYSVLVAQIVQKLGFVLKRVFFSQQSVVISFSTRFWTANLQLFAPPHLIFLSIFPTNIVFISWRFRSQTTLSVEPHETDYIFSLCSISGPRFVSVVQQENVCDSNWGLFFSLHLSIYLGEGESPFWREKVVNFCCTKLVALIVKSVIASLQIIIIVIVVWNSSLFFPFYFFVAMIRCLGRGEYLQIFSGYVQEYDFYFTV